MVVGLDKPEEGRFIARKLTDYTLGIYASAAYLEAHGAPREVEELARHRLIGYVEEYAFSTALDYVRELYGGAPTRFECASAVTQFEALRAGVGLGVVHDFIARRFQRSAPGAARAARARAAYWLVTHEDTRGLGRIRAVGEHLESERDAGPRDVHLRRRARCVMRKPRWRPACAGGPMSAPPQADPAGARTDFAEDSPVGRRAGKMTDDPQERVHSGMPLPI